MYKIKMYLIKPENTQDLSLIKQIDYSKSLGVSPEYINKILSGRMKTKLSIAKGIISMAYNIPVRDNEQMQNLLDRHFKIAE